MLAYFLDKLRKTPDGDGCSITRSCSGSNMGNSNQHLHYDVPRAGRNRLGTPAGRTASGVSVEDRADGNLLVSILDMFGVREDAIGDSTGRLTGLA